MSPYHPSFLSLSRLPLTRLTSPPTEGFDDDNSDDEEVDDDNSGSGSRSPTHSETTSLRAPSPDQTRRGGWLSWARRRAGGGEQSAVGGEDGYKAVDQPRTSRDGGGQDS